MDHNIPEQDYKEIERLIGSEESVVGIDAKKTHIMIIHMLQKLGEKLDVIESRMDELEKKLSG